MNKDSWAKEEAQLHLVNETMFHLKSKIALKQTNPI
jgi:hypothetical protein